MSIAIGVRPALNTNKRRLLSLYPNIERLHEDIALDHPLYRFDSFTVVSPSTTHIGQCEVWACPEGHSISAYSSIGCEFWIEDLFEIADVCKSIAELLARGAKYGVYGGDVKRRKKKVAAIQKAVHGVRKVLTDRDMRVLKKARVGKAVKRGR